MNLHIDQEFKSLIPPLSTEEFDQLEQNILNSGCLDPIKTWNGVIIDGHNRYEICTKHDIDFSVVEVKEIESKDDAINWIIDNQLGRRNITKEQRNYLIGLRYRQEKKQGERTDLTSGQNDQKLNTAEIIAKQNNVTEKTVRRAEKFADGVDKIAEVMPELKNEILSGKSELTSKDVADISRADADKIAEAVEQKLAEKKNKYAQVADKIKASGRVEQAVENENQAESLNIKVGDVIRAVKNKEHLVFCGDCNDEKIFAELKKCDAVVTDPPYGIAYKAPAGSALAARGNYHVLQNDEQDFDPAHLFEISDKIITWGANHYANKLPNSAGWLVWDKRDGEQINYNSDCELAWTNILGSARMFHHKWNGMIKASEHGIKRVHPTQKPVALFVWAMDVCECGNKITDPYCGSGSSIMACDETNRSCIASEIDPAYVAAIINRLKSNGFEVFINEQRI